jgi:hypothetical protein
MSVNWDGMPDRDTTIKSLTRIYYFTLCMIRPLAALAKSVS